MRRAELLLRGPAGHSLHPALAGATVGAFVTTGALGVASAIGVAPQEAAVAWWLALLVGLLVAAPTAVTDLADWVGLDRRSTLGRAGTRHLVAMGTATLAFLFAVVVGYDGYERAVVSPTALGLTLLGLGILTVGGWLGGRMVFVHGARVTGEREPSAGRR